MKEYSWFMLSETQNTCRNLHILNFGRKAKMSNILKEAVFHVTRVSNAAFKITAARIGIRSVLERVYLFTASIPVLLDLFKLDMVMKSPAVCNVLI